MKKIICVIGHSGAGKDSVISTMKQLKRIPRMTTRKPRLGEIAGIHYRFVSSQQLEDLAQRDELVYIHRHAGYLYGIERGEIDKLLKSEGQFLIVTTTAEALKIAKMAPDKVVIIYIKAPSIDVVEGRLRNRGDSEGEIKKQLESVKKNLATIDSLLPEDKARITFLVNNNLNEAIQEFKKIIE